MSEPITPINAFTVPPEESEWQHRDALHAATAAFRASTQRMLHDPGLHLIPRAALHRVAVDLHPGDTL